MPKEFWQSLNDLALLFTARPVAFPLILLLVAKLYMLNPSTLIYTLGLLFLTVLASMRWSIHLIAKHKLAFLNILREERSNNSNNER